MKKEIERVTSLINKRYDFLFDKIERNINKKIHQRERMIVFRNFIQQNNIAKHLCYIFCFNLGFLFFLMAPLKAYNDNHLASMSPPILGSDRILVITLVSFALVLLASATFVPFMGIFCIFLTHIKTTKERIHEIKMKFKENIIESNVVQLLEIFNNTNKSQDISIFIDSFSHKRITEDFNDLIECENLNKKRIDPMIHPFSFVTTLFCMYIIGFQVPGGIQSHFGLTILPFFSLVFLGITKLYTVAIHNAHMDSLQMYRECLSILKRYQPPNDRLG